MPHVSVDGRDLHYLRRGEGEPLLLIQGMSGTHVSWGEAFEAALGGAGLELITYDHRGVGYSARVEGPFTIERLADDAAGLLDALGLQEVHVLGISMGGMVAQELALRHASRLRTLTLGCTSSGGPHGPQAPPETSELLGAAMLSGDRERALRVGFEVNVSARHAAEPGAYDVFRAMALELPVPVPVILLQLQAITGHDTSDRLSEVRAPTLVIHGTGGPHAPRRRRRAARPPHPGRALRAARGGGAHVLVGGAQALRPAGRRARARRAHDRVARPQYSAAAIAAARRAPAGARRRGGRGTATRTRRTSSRASPAAGQRVEQQLDRALVLTGVQGGEGLAEVGLAGLLEPDPRGQALGLEARDGADELERLVASPRAWSSLGQGGGRRRRGRARARARGAATPRRPPRRARRPRTGRGGRRSAGPRPGGWAPTNSSTTRPPRKAFTAGMPWMPNPRLSAGLASVSTLARTTWPSRAFASRSSSGVSWRHGPHHSAQKSTTTGTSCERWTTSRSKSCSVTSRTGMRR
jgi:pimeloyl-ACP methyl ester carboxylesterase